MGLKRVIRKGDTTTHGGIVIEGVEKFPIHGKAAAVIGNMVRCPKCKGTFPIVEGAKNFPIMGKYAAVEGMKTACGAVLIASQDVLKIKVPDHMIQRLPPPITPKADRKNVVMVMTNVSNWDMLGNHAGLLINPGKSDAFLYDPGGSYCAGKGCTINGSHVQRGSGGFFEGKEVDLKHYTKYQEDDDGKDVVRYHIFYVTDEEKEQIVTNALNDGGGSVGLCARSVSAAISGVGLFKNYKGAGTPKGLRADMEKLEAQQ